MKDDTKPAILPMPSDSETSTTRIEDVTLFNGKRLRVPVTTVQTLRVIRAYRPQTEGQWAKSGPPRRTRGGPAGQTIRSSRSALAVHCWNFPDSLMSIESVNQRRLATRFSASPTNLLTSCAACSTGAPLWWKE
jgi:hypothetical protein